MKILRSEICASKVFGGGGRVASAALRGGGESDQGESGRHTIGRANRKAGILFLAERIRQDAECRIPKCQIEGTRYTEYRNAESESLVTDCIGSQHQYSFDFDEAGLNYVE